MQMASNIYFPSFLPQGKQKGSRQTLQSIFYPLSAKTNWPLYRARVLCPGQQEARVERARADVINLNGGGKQTFLYIGRGIYFTSLRPGAMLQPKGPSGKIREKKN